MDAIKNSSRIQILAFIALLVGLMATILGFYSRDGFSEDEFFEIAFINEGWAHFLVQVARLDQHPPLHYLQVKLWGAFFSSDKGLLLNSLVWHFVSCAVIFWVGRAWLGATAALLAVAFYVLAPQVVSASVSLRMYAMLPALAVGTWWLNVKLLSIDERRWWPWIGVLGFEIALGYSHAIAFYFVAWIVLAAAVQVYGKQGGKVGWKRWFAIQSFAAVLLLPLLASAVIRISMPGQSDSGGNSDPGGLIAHLGGMVVGWGTKFEYLKGLGAIFFMTAIALGLWNKKSRLMSAVILLGPYTFAAIVALFLAPMFKTPVYSAMLMPFVCLALGGGLVAIGRNWAQWLTTFLLVAMTALVFPVSGKLLGLDSPYSQIASNLKGRVEYGDVVVIPKPVIYWATMRYAVGPDWGSPLEVLPALNENWARLIGKLDPKIASNLKLFPKTNHVVKDGITYVIGDDAVSESMGAKRVWVVEQTRYFVPVNLSPGFMDKGVVFNVSKNVPTQVRLLERL